MSVKEIICLWCGERFPRRKRWKYCSKECQVLAKLDGGANREQRTSEQQAADSEWAKRLHDGARLQSDDFGEQDGDNSVTYQ